ncbi:MAG: NYN domain-containing protein [Planctomycetota bacterium]|jgi:predicted RNA-binding protein with PIN domain
MFIIDGHNLLHAILKAEEAPGVIGDVELCRILGRYLKLIGRPGEIIFDGSGPPDKSGFDDTGNLEVSFAGMGSDADSVIEDKIIASTAPKRLAVVSSDRRLRKAAHARRCVSIKSEVFWDNVRKQLSRKRPAREPAAKRQGLSESETDQWLDFLGFEQ